jgi:hypothetical protein
MDGHQTGRQDFISRTCDRLSRQLRSREDIGIFELWNAVELDPIYRSRMQNQDLSLLSVSLTSVRDASGARRRISSWS